MSERSVEKAATCPDGLAFDPQSWLTSSMAASCQARWSRGPEFKPRTPYCREQAHYPDSIYAEPSTSPDAEECADEMNDDEVVDLVARIRGQLADLVIFLEVRR